MTYETKNEINNGNKQSNNPGNNEIVFTVDLDDVLGKYMHGFLDFYNKTHGTNFDITDLKSYQLGLHIGESEERVDKLVDSFALTKEYAGLTVIQGAYETLRNLRDLGAKLYVLTSRKENTGSTTEAWINRHFPKVFSGVFYTNGQSTKGDMAANIGSKLHIDDAPKYAVDVASKGIDVLLMDSPWNKDLWCGKRITRVFGFEDIRQEVNRYVEA